VPVAQQKKVYRELRSTRQHDCQTDGGEDVLCTIVAGAVISTAAVWLNELALQLFALVP